MLAAVETDDVRDGDAPRAAPDAHAVPGARTHVPHDDLVHVLRPALGRPVKVRVADVHAQTAAAPHVAAVHAHVLHAVDQHAADPSAALRQQPHKRAHGRRADVAHRHIGDLVGLVRTEELALEPSRQAREGHRVVLREAGDVLHEDVMAAGAQVDAVRILHDDLVVGAARDRVELPPVLVDARVIRQEVELPDDAMGTGDEVQRPPALIPYLNFFYGEAGYIADLMERIALSHPEVSFKFINNGFFKT